MPRLTPRILVVDNGSTDGSVSALRTRFPDLEIVELGSNTGFSAGNNTGIRRAREAGATYAWLVNNDAEVEPGALEALLHVADRDPGLGAVGSLLVSPADGRTVEVWGGGLVDRRLGRAAHVKDVPPDGRLDYLMGASLLLRLHALDIDQALDEGFFLYWEDVDLCFRLRASGWRLAVAERSLVRHRNHGSLDRSDPLFDFHYHASAARFFRRHAIVPIAPIFVGAASRVAQRAARGQWRLAYAVLRGTAAGLRRRPSDATRRADYASK
jgi:GT2 family glycosyltransferase